MIFGELENHPTFVAMVNEVSRRLAICIARIRHRLLSDFGVVDRSIGLCHEHCSSTQPQKTDAASPTEIFRSDVPATGRIVTVPRPEKRTSNSPMDCTRPSAYLCET